MTPRSCAYFCLNFIINRLENVDISYSDLLEEIFDAVPTVDEKKSIEFVQDFENDRS